MRRILYAIKPLEGFDNGRLVASRCEIADEVTPTGKLLRYTEWSRYKTIYLLDHTILTYKLQLIPYIANFICESKSSLSRVPLFERHLSTSFHFAKRKQNSVLCTRWTCSDGIGRHARLFSRLCCCHDGAERLVGPKGM